jgi:hypothetical protein
MGEEEFYHIPRVIRTNVHTGARLQPANAIALTRECESNVNFHMDSASRPITVSPPPPTRRLLFLQRLPM